MKRLHREKYWLPEKAGKDEIRLAREVNGKVVTLRLIRAGKEKYHLVFPSYLFNSKISHFSPADDEYRFCRNKTVLMSLLKMLRRSLLWNYISNRDFLVVNDHNEKSSKSKLRKELQEALSQ